MKKNIVAFGLTVALLTGCGSSVENTDAPEKSLALEARAQYLTLNRATALVDLTADYGQRIYDFAFVMTLEGENCTLTLTKPEELAGISVTQQGTGTTTALLWEDLMLETGPLTDGGLTPITALPALLENLKSGFVDSVTTKEIYQLSSGPVLELFCRDPQTPQGEGMEYVLWVAEEDFSFLGGEIFQDGHRVITCQVQDFVMS